MFSSFGNTQNPGQQPQQQGGAPAPSGGLFGSTNNASQPATGGTSLFGNNQQQNPPAGGNQQTGGTTGGGLFGGTNTQSGGGGGLFGNPNPSNTQQSGGGLFGGSNTQNTQPGGGLFGSTNTANTQQSGGGTSTGNPLFGNAGSSNTTGGGLFGNTTGGTNTTQPSGGLFGSTNTSSNTGGTGGGLFGNAGGTNTNTTGGGLFGNTSTNTSAPSGGLFGSTNTNTNTTNASGGLFGNANPAPATSGGLFGSTTTTPNPVPGLFGNQSQAGPSTNQLFGGSTLGQAPQQQRTGSLFGGSTLGGSLGATQGNLYSSRALVPAGQTQADAQSQFVSLQQRIESIYHAWNPASPQCRFQHYFYNLVDPSQVHLYGRPANATNDALWQKAVRENPDPSCLVPVIANGLDDLQKRVEAQTQQAAMHQEKLKELRTRIQALAQRHELSNASRLHRAAALQTQLTHRVLKVVQHLHLLIPAVRSSAIRPEEEALRTALEDIDQEIRRPGGTGRIRGKLNELWALVGAVTAARERDRKTGGVEWAVVDEEGLQQIAQILEQEQAGLAHLTKILQKDLRDLAVIQGTAVKEEEPDLLMSSTSTLRGSTVY